MKLIDELFKRYEVNESTLMSYGFISKDNKYTYSKYIHNNEFVLNIEINQGHINGVLLDTNFGDIFNQINQDVTGSFVTTLKDECKEILLDIRDKCFIKELFIYPQTNRINNLIFNKYKIEPEFLWDKFPGFAIYRNQKNNKWFAIIGNVSKNKITSADKLEIEVLGLNLGDNVSSFLTKKGIYPGYHLNKKSWISIILDETLSDEEIMSLIDMSYLVVANKK